jgi:hypothetical protein
MNKLPSRCNTEVDIPDCNHTDYSNLFHTFVHFDYPVCVTNEHKQILFTNPKFIEYFEDEVAEFLSSLMIDSANGVRPKDLLFYDDERVEPVFQTRINIRGKAFQNVSFRINSYIYSRYPNKIWVTVLQKATEDKNIVVMIKDILLKVKNKYLHLFSIEECCKHGLLRLKEITNFKIGLIHYYDINKRELALVAYNGISPERLIPLTPIYERDSINKIFMDNLSKDSIICDDVLNYSIGQYLLENEMDNNYHTILILPLPYKNMLQGILTVICRDNSSNRNKLIKKLKVYRDELSSQIHERLILHNLIEQNLIYQRSTNFLTEENQMRSYFVRGLCNDIDEHLRTISRSSSILSSEYYDTGQFEGKILVNKISKNSQNLLTLVSDIQNFTDGKNGKNNNDYSLCSISIMIDEIIRNIEPIMETKNITINLGPALGNDSVKTDAVRLKQIIQYLLTRAVQYSEDSNTITIILKNNEKEFCFDIISKINNSVHVDKISGTSEIHSTDKNTIFKKDMNGLSIAQKLAEIIHGEIKIGTVGPNLLVYNFILQKYNHGSKNRIGLSRDRLRDNAVARGRTGLCFIVGDNVYSNRWLAYVLNQKGFTAKLFDDVYSLKKFPGYDRCIIIINICNRSGNLDEYINLLPGNTNSTNYAIIVVSKPDNKINAFQLGAVDYFPKPLEIDFLINRLSKYFKVKYGR